MNPITCLGDPYAHWLAEPSRNPNARDAANQLISSDVVPILVRASQSMHVDKLIEELEKTEQGLGQYRIGTSYASLIILTEYVKDWLRRFESFDISYEIGTPFASPASMFPVGMRNTNLLQWSYEKSRYTTPKSRAKKIIGIIDYGCAFANEKFCKLNNGKKSTRVFAIWDQHQRDSAPPPLRHGYKTLTWVGTPEYGYGAQAFRDWPSNSTKVGLNKYLQQFDQNGYFDDVLCYQYANYPALNSHEATHGTYIMDFAAGIPSPLKGLTDEWAAQNDKEVEDADIVFVQLPRNFQGEQVSGVLRTYVLDAIMYILDAAKDDADVVINLSYGGFAGPHDGTSLVELAIDQLIDSRNFPGKGKTEIVVCSGNSANSDMHAFRKLPAKLKKLAKACVELSVIPDNPSLQFVEMWIDTLGQANMEKARASLKITLPDQTDGLRGQSVIIGANKTYSLKNSQGQVIGKLCVSKIGANRVGGGGYRVLIGLNPTTLAAQQTLANQEALSPIGIWKITLENLCQYDLTWGSWCERHDPVFGSGHGPRQIKFAAETSVLSTTSNLASTSGKRIIVGGSILSHPEFMAEYTGRGPYRQLESHAEQDEIDNGIVYAPSEENLAYWALAGAGTLGQSKVRYSGTSVSAAVVTRALISGMTVPQLDAINRPTKSRQVFP